MCDGKAVYGAVTDNWPTKGGCTCPAGPLHAARAAGARARRRRRATPGGRAPPHPRAPRAAPPLLARPRRAILQRDRLQLPEPAAALPAAGASGAQRAQRGRARPARRRAACGGQVDARGAAADRGQLPHGRRLRAVRGGAAAYRPHAMGGAAKVCPELRPALAGWLSRCHKCHWALAFKGVPAFVAMPTLDDVPMPP
jgi:hypothetical protein